MVDGVSGIIGLITLEIFWKGVGEFIHLMHPKLYQRKELRHRFDGSFLIEGSANIRDINKSPKKWKLPTDGPKNT